MNPLDAIREFCQCCAERPFNGECEEAECPLYNFRSGKKHEDEVN